MGSTPETEALNMPDKITREQRSRNMSRIKGKDTSIEVMVRKYLFRHGFRYRKNVKKLPGTPDIVLSRYRTVIFVNGCFWHNHYGCKLAVIPKSREEYWRSKIEKNVQNDIVNRTLLEQMGYRVLTVWECELKECFELVMDELIEDIKRGHD